MTLAPAAIALSALVLFEAGCQAVQAPTLQSGARPDDSSSRPSLVGKEVLVRISAGKWVDGFFVGTLRSETDDELTLMQPEVGELRLKRGMVQSIVPVGPPEPAPDAPAPQFAPPTAPPTAPMAAANSSDGGWARAAIAAMAVTALAALAAAMFAFRARQAPQVRPIEPSSDDIASHVQAIERRLEESERSNMAAIAGLDASNREAKHALERMVQTYLALQPKLDERDREIQRLRAGLDASIFKRYVRRFARADLSVRDRLRVGRTGPESLEAVSALLEDALAECGIERFEPEVGIDFRRAEGVDDSPELVPTEDPSKEFLIAAVRRPGYRFVEGSGDRIVLPAQVAVFEFRGGHGNSAEGAS